MNRRVCDDDFHHDPNAMINNMDIDHYLGLLIQHCEGAPIVVAETSAWNKNKNIEYKSINCNEWMEWIDNCLLWTFHFYSLYPLAIGHMKPLLRVNFSIFPHHNLRFPATNEIITIELWRIAFLLLLVNACGGCAGAKANVRNAK